MARAGWRSVSRNRPCPICQGPDNCAVSHDESAAWCGRVASEKQNAGGQWFHRIGETSYAAPSQRKAPEAKRSTRLPSLVKQTERAQSHKKHLAYWAERYCVPVSSWLALRAVATSSLVQVPEVSHDDHSKVV